METGKLGRSSEFNQALPSQWPCPRLHVAEVSTRQLSNTITVYTVTGSTCFLPPHSQSAFIAHRIHGPRRAPAYYGVPSCAKHSCVLLTNNACPPPCHTVHSKVLWLIFGKSSSQFLLQSHRISTISPADAHHNLFDDW